MDILIDHFESPVNRGDRAERVSIGKYANPTCKRDFIAMQVMPDGSLWWFGSGCVTCMGAASLLCELGRPDITPDDFVAATGLPDSSKRGCILTPWLAMQDAYSISLGAKHSACKHCQHWQGLCMPMGKLCEVEKVWQCKREPPKCCPHTGLMAKPLKLSQRA